MRVLGGWLFRVLTGCTGDDKRWHFGKIVFRFVGHIPPDHKKPGQGILCIVSLFDRCRKNANYAPQGFLKSCQTAFTPACSVIFTAKSAKNAKKNKKLCALCGLRGSFFRFSIKIADFRKPCHTPTGTCFLRIQVRTITNGINDKAPATNAMTV